MDTMIRRDAGFTRRSCIRQNDQHAHSRTVSEKSSYSPVECSALSLQGKDNIERCDGLALGMLRVGDCVTNDTLKEGLEHTTGLFVDQTGDTLDTTT